MDVDDYTRSLRIGHARDESKGKTAAAQVQDHRELFDEWCALNPKHSGKSS